MFNLSRSSAVDTAAPAVAPSLPRVNLLPPEIAEAAKFRRFQFAMGAAVVAAIFAVGALDVHEHSGVRAAQQGLATAQAQHTALQTRLNSLASVQNVYDEVAAKQAMLAQAMGQQIDWSTYLADLSIKVPDNVWLNSMTATETSATTAGQATATPGSTAIGSIQFGGVAFSHDNVATWLDVLGRERGFANAYFTNSSETFIGTKKVANFSSSVDLTNAALSNRFTKPAGS
jgi:Tfp pilus assembly protein PilN